MLATAIVAVINDYEHSPEYFEIFTSDELHDVAVLQKEDELRNQGYLILGYAHNMRMAQKIAEAYTP